MNDTFRLRLPEEQEEKLIRYIKDRRFPQLVLLGTLVFLLILFFAPMAGDVMNILYSVKRADSASLPVIDPEMLTMARRYHRAFPGEMLLLWLAILVAVIVIYVRGLGTRYGPRSDLACVKKGLYVYGPVTVARKSTRTEKPPFYLYDDDGNAHTCPVFLDFRNVPIGGTMTAIVLDNGRRYCFVEDAKAQQEAQEETQDG